MSTTVRRTTIRGTVRGMAGRANPAFAAGVVVVVIGAFLYALVGATRVQHLYVHVMAGVLWTGIDLFMGLVLGPVIGGMDEESSADLFMRFTPKMTFLMPSLAITTIGAGIALALRFDGLFPHAQPWLALFTAAMSIPPLLAIGWQFDAFRDWRWLTIFVLAVVGSGVYVATTISAFAMTTPIVALALAIVVFLNFFGFGLFLPGEVKIYLQMASGDPDTAVVRRIGLRNARLSGAQGLLQLGIIGVMVLIRWGVWTF